MKERRINKNIIPGKCSTYRCKNKPKGKAAFCGSCKTRMYRLKNPTRYAFQNLKHRAEERGIEFKLTFEEFEDFCKETGHLEKKGKGSQHNNVDRIREGEPYQRDNIQSLNKLKNIYKYYDWRTKQMVTIKGPEVPDEDLPF